MLCTSGSLAENIIMVWGDGITAVAYYWLTYQLLAFAVNSKILKLTSALRNNKDKSKRTLFYMLLGLACLFASFIALCGNTHSLHVLRYFFPDLFWLRIFDLSMMILAAMVSVCTAIIGSKLFPVILKSLGDFELNSEGGLQHIENYLIEVVELMKEGILVLSENMTIMRCNEASKTLLHCQNLLDKTYTDFIHPSDLHIFNNAVIRVLGSYNMTPVTIEYRVNQKAFPSMPHNDKTRKKTTPVGSFYSPLSPKSTSRVYAAAPLNQSSDDHEEVEMVNAEFPRHTGSCSSRISLGGGTSTLAGTSMIDVDLFSMRSTDRDQVSHTSQGQVVENEVFAENEKDYIWVEATICKGMSINQNDDFEYDIKLVCRDIEDRKRAALREHNDLVRENDERDRMNAAKLRYISCIAHDLKTPLQSFCFTLDLLNQTHMHREQREYVQQANVAVDLMRLTISQTMDISKALTGAKLMPRRTTVNLSTVMSRVEIIINGYGKQVPVSFKLARDVCDRIITDEEWLWQMVLNLLTNACKYTDKGEIRVTVSKTNGSEEMNREFEEEMLMVEVVDTGVGVTDDKLGSMFEAFAQVQEGQVTGTGLGLFGVRTRAEGLQGTCGARHNTESSTGSGTVLWFSIPYVPDTIVLTGESTKSPANPTPSSPTPTDDFAITPKPTLSFIPRNRTASTDLAISTEDAIRRLRLTAMVVEDTLTVRKLMQQLLIKMGFERVDCYENGSKGLEAMMAAPVDIVFSDVQMPIMTGPEMVSRFRKWEADTLRAAVQSTRSSCASSSADHFSAAHGNHSSSGSVPPSPMNRPEGNNGFNAVSSASQLGVAVLTLPSPLHKTGLQPTVSAGRHSGLSLAVNVPAINTTHMPQNYSSNPQTARYMRTVRPRQLIVAVTANGAECGKCGENGFDEICLKPLAKTEIYQIINRYFA